MFFAMPDLYFYIMRRLRIHKKAGDKRLYAKSMKLIEDVLKYYEAEALVSPTINIKQKISKLHLHIQEIICDFGDPAIIF